MWGVRVLIAICVALGVTLADESIASEPLARISHHCSTVAALCGIPDDFHSVRALNSVSTMPAHSSVAKDTWDTTFHRLATKGGEKCGLVPTITAPALPGTSTEKPGAGMFLVARRALDGSHFSRSVIYLVEHDEEGTLGLIVNRASDISLPEAVPDIEDKRTSAHALYYGGPVGLPMILMLVRSESAIEGMVHVADDIYISSDRRVLDEALAAQKPASEIHFYFGYSGWAAGQLDHELLRGSWHVVAADTDSVFSSDTGSLWEQLIKRLEPSGIQVDSSPFLPALTLATSN